ncbi:hypothetical protein PsorP6_010457 [Peronosclerospora sorghi]|uniref:Uncharacterized protein n=1 Tax=Peronosclerospora sorghi TaxID=230839 RepID=A0ACC0VXQ3_9STRA|nr:hypothetical protein PsorP6_010457 [Peronosclerospora sorghi]
MADAAPVFPGKRGGFGCGGRGREESKELVHVTKLDQWEIVNYFLESSLKDEVMKIMPVQKQTTAGQRTRFKAFVAVGDCNGHIGLGVIYAKEVDTAIRGAIIQAKISLVPLRRGYGAVWLVHRILCRTR